MRGPRRKKTRPSIIDASSFVSAGARSQMRTAIASSSRKQALHYACRDRAGEFLIEALELVGEPVVVDAKAVKDCRVEVAHGNGVFDDVVAVVVGLAVSDAGAN